MLLSQLFKHRTIYYGLLKVQIIDSMKYIFLFYPWNWTLLLKLFLCQVWEITADKHHAGSVLHTLGWPLDPKTYGGSFLYHMEDRQVFLIDTCIPSWNDNWVCNLIHKVAFNWRNLLNGSSDTESVMLMWFWCQSSSWDHLFYGENLESMSVWIMVLNWTENVYTKVILRLL